MQGAHQHHDRHVSLNDAMPPTNASPTATIARAPDLPTQAHLVPGQQSRP